MKEKYLKTSNIKNFIMDHSICTETATFLIGDCDALDKEQNKYELAMEKQDSKSYDYFQYNKYIIVAPDNPHLQKDLPDIESSKQHHLKPIHSRIVKPSVVTG